MLVCRYDDGKEGRVCELCIKEHTPLEEESADQKKLNRQSMGSTCLISSFAKFSYISTFCCFFVATLVVQNCTCVELQSATVVEAALLLLVVGVVTAMVVKTEGMLVGNRQKRTTRSSDYLRFSSSLQTLGRKKERD
jgi:hypothetical protein